MTSVMNILFLGTGTSTGVPQIGCSCAVCTSPDPRNRRLRSSIYVEAAGTRLLLDSSPDLRQQALRENITDVDAVLYTHAHVDHVGGFDDLRAFCWRRSGGLPMYASPMTVDALRTMYGWAFVPKPGRSGYVRPEPHEVTAPFRVGNVLATPLPVLHAGVETYAYLLEAEGRSLVYMPDVKSIPAPSLERMKGVDLLIIDGLRYHLHPTHMCLEETLAAIAAVRETLAPLRESDTYDYCIMDTPPSLGVLMTSALAACDEVLTPLQCEWFGLEGLAKILHVTAQICASGANPRIRHEGVLMTMYDGRTNLSRQVIDQVERHLPQMLYKTVIPRSIRLGEAPSFGHTIFEHDPSGAAADAYLKAAREFIKRHKP